MTAAFDQTETITRSELIARAIHGIRNPRRRERLRKKFEANPNKLFDRLAGRCGDCETEDADQLAEFIEHGMPMAIDPEKLKRWIEIIKIILPLILRFL